MLRFLADENFPGDAIEVLSQKGYDIKWIGNFAAGSSDEQVLEIAMKEEKIRCRTHRLIGKTGKNFFLS